MPKINVVDFNDVLVDSVIVGAGETFADAAMSTWPDGWPALTPRIYGPDGEIVTEERAINEKMKKEDVWVVKLLPQGPETFLMITYTQWAVMAISLAASLLLAPKLPNVSGGPQSYEWEDSNRPQFYSGQTNRVQSGRRIPDIFGRVRHYPDLMSTPAIEYTGNTQTIREMYVISRGRAECSDARFHDESYSEIKGTTINYYYPNQKWPSGFPIMRQNAAVGGIDIPAPNENIASSFTYQIRSGYIFVDELGYWDEFETTVGAGFMLTGVDAKNRAPRSVTGFSPDGRYMYVQPSFGLSQNINGGQINFQGLNYISLKGSAPRVYNIAWESYNPTDYRYGSFEWTITNQYRTTVPAIAPFTNNGVLVSTTTFEDYKTSIVWDNRFHGGEQFGNPIPPISGPHNYVQFTNSDFIYTPNIPGSGYATAEFNVPGISTEAWLDFECATGLYTQKSGEPPQARTVQLKIWYKEQGEPASAYKSVIRALGPETTRSPIRYTSKLFFPKAAKWEVYVERITPMIQETGTRITQDAVRWIGLSGRQDTSELNDDVLNCTIADVRLSTHALSQAGQDRRFNVIAERKMYSWRSGKTYKTRTIADAITHTFYKMGNIQRKNVDEASLFAIQNELEAQGDFDGEFNAVVDQTMTVEDQVGLIASVGRIMVYRRGSTFYFKRLKAGIIPTTLINGRNKTEPESRNFSFSENNDPDAIVIRYRNQNDNYREATYQYPEGGSPINVDEQTLLGCTHPTVAARIAQYNWNRGKYEKDTISLKIMEEGILLSPGDVISVTDFLTEEKPYEGEIVGVSGTKYTFDQDIPPGTYNAQVRDEFGTLYSTSTVTIGSKSDQSVHTIADWAGIAMPSWLTSQTGLLYSFSVIQTDNRDQFYVVKVTPDREGYVSVDGILYRDETYQGDQATSFQATTKQIESKRLPNTYSESFYIPESDPDRIAFGGSTKTGKEET